ncbi:MAG: prepilin peptidase [Alphaproteobacteria bacterium]|nr:prepilin peptidase [Alphaproteobacteria bacterium]
MLLLDFSDKSVIFLMLASAVIGFVIPHFARRFSKIMPCVPPNMLVELLRVPRYVFAVREYKMGEGNVGRTIRYAGMLKLRSRMVWGSFLMAFLMAVLSIVLLSTHSQPLVFWLMGFVLVSFLLAVIDIRYELLPDVLTIPLLLAGFAFAVWGGGEWVTIRQSVLGALAGYMMPTIVGVLMYWKNTYAFGGGDFKMLAAVGAWVGIERLNIAILFSVIIFAIFALIKRKHQGPYGLAIALGSLITLLIPIETILSIYNG